MPEAAAASSTVELPNRPKLDYSDNMTSSTPLVNTCHYTAPCLVGWPPVFFSVFFLKANDPQPLRVFSCLLSAFHLHIFKHNIMGGHGNVFSLAQVSEHNNSKDCWIIINHKVYDVTKFLEDHPGGDEVLISATGKDATDDFEDVGHSPSAREMMDQYCVGNIDVSTIPKKKTYTPPKQPHYNQDKTSEFIIRLLQFIVPLAILGLAVAIRIYTKSN